MTKQKNKLFSTSISRRNALKASGIAMASLLAPGLAGLYSRKVKAENSPVPGTKKVSPFRRNTEKRPNIIFILSDDHRWDAMGCMGHPTIKTPNMDRLSQEGILFKNAFVTTSLCSPSRASFLTGQYARNHGVRNNLLPWDNKNTTFLELLKGAGYRTGFIGKWHMPGKLPRLRGLDRFVTFTASGGQGVYFDCPMIVDGKETPSRKKYITDELTDYALDFIQDNHEEPFCLYLSHKAVHFPFTPPDDLKDLYKGQELKLPPESDTWTTLTNGNFYPGTLQSYYQKYLACVTGVDRSIGSIMKNLEAMNIADNTVVIYAGDNGHFFGEHHLYDKRWAYEESIRVPFIVRFPRMIKNPGSKAKQMILNIDLAPTLLDIAGLKIPDSVDGMSILPLLKKRKTRWRRAWLYEYFKDYSYSIPDIKAVRTSRYKYIEYGNRQKPELYDLQKDPGEKKNIYGTPGGKTKLPGLKKKLRELLKGEKYA